MSDEIECGFKHERAVCGHRGESELGKFVDGGVIVDSYSCVESTQDEGVKPIESYQYHINQSVVCNHSVYIRESMGICVCSGIGINTCNQLFNYRVQ